MTTDLTSVDLIALIGGKLKFVSGTCGGEYAGPCPICGGTDRLKVQPNATPRLRWWCRQCSPDEHWHDAIDFVRLRDGVSFREACTRLQITVPKCHDPLPPAPPDAVEPPSDTWQSAAREFVIQSMATLHQTEAAKQYLINRRGMTLSTLTNALLGYNPVDYYVPRTVFGLPPEQDALGNDKQLWLPRGIVIPWFVEGKLWKISIRRFQRFQGDTKYYNVPGGSNALYGADKLLAGKPAVIVEGVFDALAVQQEAGDLVAAVATGATGARRVRWIAKLALASTILASHDSDHAGEQAALYWAGVFGTAAKRWQPLLKDVSEMLAAGLDVRQWISAGLPSVPAPVSPFPTNPTPSQVQQPTVVQAQPDHADEYSIEGIEQNGCQQWRLWSDRTNTVIATFPTQAEALAAAQANLKQQSSRGLGSLT